MVLLDYTGWSAPVSGQNVLGFSPATVVSRFYEYNPTTNAYVSLSSPSTTDFTFAKGLLVRAPNTWSTSVAAPYLGQFTGVPNNGTNTYSGLAGFNLVGNPYPSPIDLDLFETDNGTSVEADYYFWTNSNPAVSGSYSGTNNYASYNSASQTGASAQNGSTTPDGIVAVGQGFFVNLSADATLTFNNGQRVTSGGAFMRSASTTEKHRLWFGLTSPGFNHNQIAVAYVTGMSNDYDAGDTKMFANNKSSIYTPVGTNKLVIQGRALPFTASDEVALGFFAETAGQYTINLANKDGLFAGTQEVYLRDNLLNVIHDIKNSEYTFTSEAGDFASRFTVVYSTTALSNENPIFTKDNVIVSASENGITINAGTTLIKQVNVFDVRGRLLTTQTNINATSVNISNLKADQQVLIVQVIATDGAVLSKKVVK
ncbi:T9SS sorting signal type C domain-containing protein [Flavobacterium sp.]|uniref:T9SS sorting signal type C domain-containing protein n=1 Tax=Flavobacterium sp. TaxID=239 RepID=UPI003F6A16ED